MLLAVVPKTITLNVLKICVVPMIKKKMMVTDSNKNNNTDLHQAGSHQCFFAGLFKIYESS